MRKFQVFQSPATDLRLLRSSAVGPKIKVWSGDKILRTMWRKAGPVQYPTDTTAHPYTPSPEPKFFLVFAWHEPTTLLQIDEFRAQRESLGFPVEHVVMGLGELEYQIFWRDMGQKQYAAQQATIQEKNGPHGRTIEDNLEDKFLLNRALIVDVAHSYNLAGLPMPPDRPYWVLLEDIAAMSQWRLLPPGGDTNHAWPLWGIGMR